MPVTDGQVERWLEEDLGHHDVETDLPGAATGRIVADEPGVAAGLAAAASVFEYLGCEVTRAVAAGDRVDPGEPLLTVEGPTRAVLRGRGVATNVVAHAAGVATEAWAAREAAAEANEEVVVAATRETTPGLRGVEKRAVAAAGCDPHRLDRSHAVVVDGAHVDALGLREAVGRFRERASATAHLTATVDDPDDAEVAVEAGADGVRFDGLPPEEVAVGVASVADDVLTEVAGGVTHTEVRAYARTGVDVVAMGLLTASARSLDLSFETA